MKAPVAEAIQAKLYDMGHRDVEIIESYMGRGMMSARTTALTGDVPLMLIGWAGAAVGIEWRDMPKRTDAMGMGVVAY